MSISFSYKSITDSCEGNKFSKISTVSTDPVSCTTQNTLLSYKEASCELSWVLSHILWCSLSEQQELGRVLGVEVRYEEGRGSVHWREMSREEGAAHLDALGRGSGW